jgi:hypothetical protein
MDKIPNQPRTPRIEHEAKQEEAVPESPKNEKKLALFAAAWGNGKADTRNGESREHFEYDAGQAAVKDIRQYGQLCRTREGDLYFTSTELPWKLVPLIHDDPRLIALIDHVFQIRASSTQAFKVILCSLQNAASKAGLNLNGISKLDPMDPKSKVGNFSATG